MLLILEQIWKMLLCDLGINDYFVIDTFNDKGRFLEFTVISLLALKVSSARGICCLSANHTALRRKSKDWMARNQANVSKWGRHVYLWTIVSVN
jgi:hypothetical protein